MFRAEISVSVWYRDLQSFEACISYDWIINLKETVGMATISETENIVFEDLLFFEHEVTRPQIVKQEIDAVMPKLRKLGINHKNIVISKVVHTNLIKKTMTIQLRIPIE